MVEIDKNNVFRLHIALKCLAAVGFPGDHPQRAYREYPPNVIDALMPLEVCTSGDCMPKGGDALRLGSKGRYGSFHLWINVWVAGKTVIPS